MKINEILKEASYNTDRIWYHGSGMDFEHFDIKADTTNRTTNVEGIYLTKNEDLAREYANMQENGIVYEVDPEISNPFSENTSKINKEMVQKYSDLLKAHTTYAPDWVDTAIVPDYVETGKMKSDINGAIKRQVYMAGGYDSYWFNDMGENVLVVFDADDITILNKFTPQELKKDDNYDSPIKPEKPPAPTTEPDSSSMSGLDDFESWLSGDLS